MLQCTAAGAAQDRNTCQDWIQSSCHESYYYHRVLCPYWILSEAKWYISEIGLYMFKFSFHFRSFMCFLINPFHICFLYFITSPRWHQLLSPFPLYLDVYTWHLLSPVTKVLHVVPSAFSCYHLVTTLTQLRSPDC